MNSHFAQANRAQAIHYVRRSNAAAETTKHQPAETAAAELVVCKTRSGLRSFFHKLGSQRENRMVAASPAQESQDREQKKLVWWRQIVISQSMHAQGRPGMARR
jgi:hypothetical protein